MLESHLAGRVHLSFEDGEALGTAGALGHLRDWIAGRPVLVVNGDTWCPQSMEVLLDGWDGERIRVLVAGTRLVRGRRAGGRARCCRGATWPTSRPQPLGLTPIWLRAAEAGRVEPCGSTTGVPVGRLRHARVVPRRQPALVGRRVGDRCGRRSSTAPSSGASCGPDASVRRNEHLVDAIRADDRITVLVRCAAAVPADGLEGWTGGSRGAGRRRRRCRCRGCGGRWR